MSKHWNPRILPDGVSAGRRPFGKSGVRKRVFGLGWSDIRLTLIAGLVLGLLYAVATFDWSSGAQPDLRTVPVPDYYAESKRSGAILRGQEHGPLPVTRSGASGTVAVGADAIVDVIDGDTFRVGGDTIRIADIDTPEIHPARCPYEAELGERATRRLAVLLSQGPFKLQPIGRDTDRYGRKLRVVTRGGYSVGNVLVAEGLARTWTGRREPWCS
jgi:micrococcal nuclease